MEYSSFPSLNKTVTETLGKCTDVNVGYVAIAKNVYTAPLKNKCDDLILDIVAFWVIFSLRNSIYTLHFKVVVTNVLANN